MWYNISGKIPLHDTASCIQSQVTWLPESEADTGNTSPVRTRRPGHNQAELGTDTDQSTGDGTGGKDQAISGDTWCPRLSNVTAGTR